MPKAPKFFVDIIENNFTRKTTVTEVHNYHPKFKKIVFAGEDLKKRECLAGGQIEPRVSATDMRHYSPSAYDRKNAVGEMLIYLHGMGEGSRWAENLKAGDKINMMGPANKLTLDTTAPKVVFLGDETAIGTFLFMQNSLTAKQKMNGVVETETALTQIPNQVNLNLPALARKEERGEVLLQWLTENFPDNKNALFYLVGHAQTNKKLRDFLKDNGIGNSQIVAEKYWADGKSGL